MAQVENDVSFALRARVEWDIVAKSGDKTFSTAGKTGIEFEKTAKKVLKTNGIVVKGNARSGSIVLRCHAPVLKFIAFSLALHQRDPTLMDALKKGSPADVTVRLSCIISCVSNTHFLVFEFSLVLIRLK